MASDTVKGLRAAKAAFQALPEITRDAMLDATRTTASEIVRFAKGRIQSSPSIRTRQLLNHIEFKINNKSGRAKVGISNDPSPLKMQPYEYAHFVEFGTRDAPAEPFMIPAADDQQKPYLDRVRAAGRVIENRVANVGMRNL